MLKTGVSELAAFMAVAEQRSFRAAARTLEVSPSALSHAMRALEERLGARLLNRTTRSVALTEAGEKLLNRIRPALTDIDDALQEVTNARERPSGALRINSSESAAMPLLQHVLPDFLARYPDIHIEFVVDSRLVDIVAAGYDAGIRIAEAVPKDMIAVKFGPDIRFAAVASPDYLARHAPPQVPLDLLKHRCIRFRFESGALYRWDMQWRGRPINLDVTGPITVGSMRLAIEAAVQGIGIAWINEAQIEEHLASGRLVRLLGEWSPSFPGLCLYYPANRHPPTALRLFVQAVRDWMAQLP
ncbi:DNA-binding transcriptional LysR family regulator [Silvimonas terrae]|uniref:DNA-binding transcriptional LysR family regulator n=1 Tax=Silvimonas terrae TaxID=300266 RepID=A0A840RF80_9NEIS|nr:LysR family transcriptional regulator [Silvimonas terrae]MBB5191168.1 DNA-binding transcriptional LysR family regulator [Silvimonas terrae]